MAAATLGTFVGLTLLDVTTPRAAAAETKPGAQASVAVELINWDQTLKRVAAHKGKIVVLDAWSTSCSPCVKEFPNLVKLHKRHQGQEVVCMSLSCDYQGIKSKPPEFYKERVLKFLEKNGATFENFLCTDEAEVLYDKLKVASIPAVLVYGRDGKLVKCFNNDEAEKEEDNFTYEDVFKLVEVLLSKKQ
jgi:thiol-disulfide isomerase/thioredoxin